MLDIIGNIKIDESKPERINYFLACLKSWKFFKDHCKFYINLEDPSTELLNSIHEIIQKYNYDFDINTTSVQSAPAYGTTYMQLLNKSDNPFVLNFIEDQFMLLDDADIMLSILETMKHHNVDVLKSSFLKVEQNSQNTLQQVTDTDFGKVFLMDERNHSEYGAHYGGRYLLGVNFITTREFALKFWDRDCGMRPHEYEISSYNEEWKHICMIPNIEILCAIDDDHGEPATCLLNRNEEKWNRIYEVKTEKPVIEQSSIPALAVYEPAKPITKKTSFSYNKSPFVFNDLRSENESFKQEMLFRLEDIVQSGTYLLGDQCKELEIRFAQLIGKKYCISVKNGTDALVMAIRYALLDRPDASVILPNFGAYPTAIAVKNCTDNIHFLDVDESMTMDVKKLPDIKNGIIIPVHLFGNNCNMKAIKRYADQNGNIIIEDCAQSTGSGSGQTGDLSIFSFYPTKPLGTMGDGGAILTDSKEDFNQLLAMRNYGLVEGKIEKAGINSRMGELECAVVNSKINKFEHLIEKRRMIANRYKKIVDGIRINSNHIYHQFTMLFNERELIIEELKKENIPYMIHYPEHISDMPVFSYLKHEVGFRVNDKIISLPCHPFMAEEQIQQVEEFLKKHKQYEY